MKNIIKSFAFAIISLTIISCSENKKAEKSIDDFERYVMEHNDNTDKYYDKEWKELDEEFNAEKVKAEEHMELWDDQMRARYDNTKYQWENFRENYLAEANRRDAITGTDMVMSTLLPKGINNDMSNVTQSNILEVYTHFVTTADAMKDNLTREQWDQTEILWERLDTRKNELEKDMDRKVKMAIAEQKLDYGTIKAVNRPMAKSDENSTAKEEKNEREKNEK